MEVLTTIRKGGTLTIPKNVRELYRLNEGDKVFITIQRADEREAGKRALEDGLGIKRGVQ